MQDVAGVPSPVCTVSRGGVGNPPGLIGRHAESQLASFLPSVFRHVRSRLGTRTPRIAAWGNAMRKLMVGPIGGVLGVLLLAGNAHAGVAAPEMDPSGAVTAVSLLA